MKWKKQARIRGNADVTRKIQKEKHQAEMTDPYTLKQIKWKPSYTFTIYIKNNQESQH